MSKRAVLGASHLFISLDKSTSYAINRKTLQLESPAPASSSPIQTIDFKFVLGVYSINSRTYIVFVTSVSPFLPILDVNIVRDYRILQLDNGPADSASEGLLKNGLGFSTLYYSQTRDLTAPAQLQARGVAPREIFLWNAAPIAGLRTIVGDTLNSVILPVVAGFIDSFKRPDYTFVLIARRSPQRAGVRFWVRGSDNEGYVANYVEVEQLVIGRNVTFSYVQVRGSIPFLWSQYPDLTRLPDMKLVGDPEFREVTVRKHFDRLHAEFGHSIVVSLTDNKGREKVLTDVFNVLGPKVPNVRYHYFDFHHECANLQWQHISKLFEQMQDGIDAIGYTKIVDGNATVEQNGIVRSNCVDCLDRTTVVQTMIAREQFERQLRELNVTSRDWEQAFRNIWADMADVISIQYGGTKALKTDFTRTGKRTQWGVYVDKSNSYRRYYVNTIVDGKRQDAYDAVTQTVPCNKYDSSRGWLLVVLAVLRVLIIYWFVRLTKGAKEASQRIEQYREETVDRPQFRDAEIRPGRKVT
jgi:hypothetical protein